MIFFLFLLIGAAFSRCMPHEFHASKDLSSLPRDPRTRNFTQLQDHFDPSNKNTWPQR